MRGVAAALVLFTSGAARAGNLDGFPLGNEAAMTGGAVVAETHDAAALWYDPAGLAALDRDSIDGSASLLVVRVRRIPHAVDVYLPDRVERPDASSVKLLSVPSSLVTARRLGDRIGVAAGLFVPRQDALDGDAFVHAQGPGYRYDLSFQLLEQVATYDAGAAIGFAISPRVRVGAALFVVYDSIVSALNLGAQYTVNGTTTSGTFARKAHIDLFSLRATVGTQIDVAEHVRVGIVLRSPAPFVTGTQRLTGTDSSGGALSTIDERPPLPSFFSPVDPLRAHLAIAWVDSRGHVEIGGDHQLARRVDGVTKQEAVTNVHLGGRLRISDHVAIGAGVYTDGSTTPRDASKSVIEAVDHLGASRIAYVGGTVGAEYRRRYAVTDPPPARGLDFGTTLAVRWSYGWGVVHGTAIHPADGAIASSANDVDVRIHEIGLHIGSALYF